MKRISGREVHAPGVLSYFLDNKSGAESEWEKLFVIYNAGDERFSVPCPEGEWVILADKAEANCRKMAKVSEGKIMVDAHGGLLLGRKAG